ncbi:porin family protein [Vibrio litoralis]|uniref:porin family protein n=1 Tax=Vibrio litoralis TaxID=335972 RepID=UPI00040D9FEA|nr:porin family protein [Vibrio litoralis]
MKNLKLVLCLLGTTLPIAAPTLAADADTTNRDFSGFYLGSGFGQSYFSDDDIAKEQINSNAETDTSSTSHQIYGGYYFNKIVGVEANYINYGDVKVKSGGQTFGKESVKSYSVAANIGYTFDNGIRLFALPGLAYVDSDLTEDNVGFHFGTGVEYTPNFLPHLSVRAIYQGDLFFSEEENNDGDAYSLVSSTLAFGVAYRF